VKTGAALLDEYVNPVLLLVRRGLFPRADVVQQKYSIPTAPGRKSEDLDDRPAYG
jgi:hypothetical protein